MTIKKLLALALAVTMTCTMIACGNSGDNASREQAQEQQAQEKQTAGDEADPERGEQTEGDSVFPLAEPVTLKVFAVQIASVVELEQNTVFQDLEKYTNVDFELTMVPADGASEKLNLMLASGEYPDIIMGTWLMSNQDLEKYGVQEQVFISLNDLIDQYGTNIKERWAEHPNWENEMKSSDGNIYGIPTADSGGEGHGDCSYKMWMNTEWLKAVGKEMPTTTEEFKDVLTAFKTQDPNGNGIADEIPLTGAANTWAADPYLYLLNAFGYFNTDYYYLKDGTVKGILDQDYLKEGLKYVHELYADGLIDPASLTQDESQMSAVGNNEGTIIAGAASCGHVGMFVDINNAERYNQYEIMMPLKGSTGYCAIPYNTQYSVRNCREIICIFLEFMLIYVMKGFDDFRRTYTWHIITIKHQVLLNRFSRPCHNCWMNANAVYWPQALQKAMGMAVSSLSVKRAAWMSEQYVLVSMKSMAACLPLPGRKKSGKAVPAENL